MFKRVRAQMLGGITATLILGMLSQPAVAVCSNTGSGTVTSPNANDNVVCTNTDANLDIVVAADNVSILLDDNATLTDSTITFSATPNGGLVTLDPGSTISSSAGTVRTILIANTDVVVDTGATVNGDSFGISSSSNDAATVTVRGNVNGQVASISFGGGNDQLILDTGANLIGDVLGNGGADLVTLNGSGTLNASLLDFETINADGASWQLTQLIDGSIVNVNSGTLTLAALENGELNMSGGTANVDGSISDSVVNVINGTLVVGQELRNANVTINPGQNLISTGQVGLQGTTSINIGAGGTLTFDIASGNGGATNNGAITGAGSIVKNGAGGLLFGGFGNRSFTGGVTVNQGMLTLEGGPGIGTNDVLLNNDTVLAITGNGGLGTHEGNFTGTGSFVKEGTYRAILTGNNTFSGGARITDGQVIVDSSGHIGTGTVSVEGTGILTYNISGTETLTETVTGDGLVRTIGVGDAVWEGDASSFTGTLLVGSNSLTLNENSQSGTADIQVNTGLRLSGANVANTIIGGGRVESSGVTTLAGIGTYTGGTTVLSGELRGEVNSFGTGAIVVNDAVLTITSDSTTTFDNNVSGIGQLRKEGSGTIGIAGTLSHTGGIDVRAGRLNVLTNDIGANAVTVGNSGTLGITVAGGETGIPTNEFSVSGTLAKSGLGTLSFTDASRIGGRLLIESGTVAIGEAANGVSDLFDSGVITAGTNLDITADDSITLDTNLIGDGALTKRGSGEAVLSGNVDFDGNIDVLSGSLLITQGALGDANISIAQGATFGLTVDQSLELDSSVTSAGTFRKTGLGTLTLDNSVNIGGTLDIAAGDVGLNSVTGGMSTVFGQINVAADSALVLSGVQDLVLDASLTGDGALVKTGASSATLRGTNSFSGGIRINEGRVIVADVASLGSGAVTMSAGGELQVSSTSAQTLGGNLSGGTLIVDGQGELTLTGTNDQSNQVSGALRGSADALGTSVEILNGGTVVIDETADISTDIAISNSGGRLVKAGTGRVRISADGSLGQTDINAGRLELDGDVSGIFNVAQGAALGGSGTLTGDVSVDGILTPGNSVGSLTIDGDLTLGSTSTLEVELNSTNSDLLTVTGSTSLAGDLLLIPLDCSDGAGLTFLTSQGGVSGTFATVSVQGGGEATIIYDANSVSIDNDDVLTLLTARPTTANSQMSISSQTTADFGASVMNYLKGAQQGRADGLWLAGFAERNARDPIGGSLGYDLSTYGTIIGASKALTDHWSAGFSFTHAKGSADLDSRAGNTDVTSTLASFFVRHESERWNSGAGVIFGRHSLDTDRSVTFDGVREVLRGDTDGDVLGAFAFTQFAIDLGDWQLAPGIRLQISETDLDAYSEGGSSPLRLAIDQLQADQGQAALSARFSRTFTMSNSAKFTPHVEFGVSRDFTLGNRDIEAVFLESETPVLLEGDTTTRTQWLFGAGLRGELAERWGWFFDLQHVSAEGDARSRALLGVNLEI